MLGAAEGQANQIMLPADAVKDLKADAPSKRASLGSPTAPAGLWLGSF